MKKVRRSQVSISINFCSKLNWVTLALINFMLAAPGIKEELWCHVIICFKKIRLKDIPSKITEYIRKKKQAS